jgi:hypothetical protein
MWKPEIGEKILVNQYLTQILSGVGYEKEFVGYNGTQYVCQEPPMTTKDAVVPCFSVWNYARPIEKPMPKVPDGMFYPDPSRVEYNWFLSLNQIDHFGHLAFTSLNLINYGFFRGFIKTNTKKSLDLTYKPIYNKASLKEGSWYFKGNIESNDSRKWKNNYKLYINGKFYFPNSEDALICHDVISVTNVYEIVEDDK